MKVKEMIEALQKCNLESEVTIRFALDKEDEIGYYLEPFLIENMFKDDVYIYAEYTATKEDSDFIGQYDLKEAYKLIKEREEK